MRQQEADGDWPQQHISGVFNRNCMITYANYRLVVQKLHKHLPLRTAMLRIEYMSEYCTHMGMRTFSLVAAAACAVMYFCLDAGTSSQSGRWQSTTHMCRTANTATQARSDSGAANFEDSFGRHVGVGLQSVSRGIGVGQQLLA